MTSVLPAGRYKQKKEWSTSSIPELVANATESSEDVENNEPTTPTMINNNNAQSGIEIQVNGIPQQFSTARRASLASALFSENDRKLSQQLSTAPTSAPAKTNNNKRRSSIAVAFLGRKDNTKVTGGKDEPDRQIEGDFINFANNQNVPQSKNDEPTKGSSVFYDSNDPLSDFQLGLSDKDPRKKRRSSWQAKMERRRRKSLANTRIDENSVSIHVDSTPEDPESDSEEQHNGGGAEYLSSNGGGVGLPLGAPGNPYQRQKRHSWWNILVPDNLKTR